MCHTNSTASPVSNNLECVERTVVFLGVPSPCTRDTSAVMTIIVFSTLWVTCRGWTWVTRVRYRDCHTLGGDVTRVSSFSWWLLFPFLHSRCGFCVYFQKCSCFFLTTRISNLLTGHPTYHQTDRTKKTKLIRFLGQFSRLPIWHCPLSPFSNPIVKPGLISCRDDSNCCGYVQEQIVTRSSCTGRVVQDRNRQQHNQWVGESGLLMERMEHTHCGRRFVDTGLDDSLLFCPQRSITSTTSGSSLISIKNETVLVK
jgi:hypothetical protein